MIRLNNSEIDSNIIQKWNEIECNKLRKIFEFAKARNKSHSFAAYWNNIIGKLLTYSSFLISAIISTISLNLTDTPIWLLPALSITINLVIIINGFFDFSRSSESHRKTSILFSNLSNKIEISILQKEIPKVRFSDFMDEIINDSNQIMKDSPSLPVYAKNTITDIKMLEPPNIFE